MMKSFDDVFEEDDASPLVREVAETGWNKALAILEASLDTADNIGDVKDTIHYMRTDS